MNWLKLINNNNSENREKFLEGFTKPFNDKLQLSQAISNKTVKIHSGGIRRFHGKTSSQAESGLITANDVNKLKLDRQSSS